MKVPMDNPTHRVIEFKATTDAPRVAIKERDYSKRQCDHGQFVVDEKNRTVECGLCHINLDAMHVLVLLAYSERRRRWAKENAEAYDRKQSEKTIKAAVIALTKRGVHPGKFSELYDKYKSLAAEVKP